MQFLITYLKDLVGRGLPAAVIVELIVYSLAYMVSLAVPMAVLVTTLLAFGRLAESRAYAVAKGAGISRSGGWRGPRWRPAPSWPSGWCTSTR